MGVLQDIVKEATAKDGDVPLMLRLCLVLGKRLGHEPLTQWVLQELEGYAVDAPLPSYRKFNCRNRGIFENTASRTKLDIPLSILPEALRPHYQAAEIRDGVGELAHLLTLGQDKGVLQIPWPPELAIQFGSKLTPNADCIKAWREISAAELAGSLDQVKTKVLAFALDIECESPNAGDIPGTDYHLKDEKVTQIFNTNIAGNVQNLASGSQHVTQTATSGVTQGDLTSLLTFLRLQGMADKDVAALKEAIDTDKEVGMGDAVKKWTGDLVTRATTGAVEMGLQKITEVVLPAVTGYFGL